MSGYGWQASMSALPTVRARAITEYVRACVRVGGPAVVTTGISMGSRLTGGSARSAAAGATDGGAAAGLRRHSTWSTKEAGRCLLARRPRDRRWQEDKKILTLRGSPPAHALARNSAPWRRDIRQRHRKIAAASRSSASSGAPAGGALQQAQPSSVAAVAAAAAAAARSRGKCKLEPTVRSDCCGRPPSAIQRR